MLRRLGVCLAGLIGLFALASFAQADDLRPGDFGYRHAELHHYYQQIADQPVTHPSAPGDAGHRTEEFKTPYGEIFGTGKCSCVSGQCRQTDYKANSSSPTGFDVLIDGVWCPVPEEAWLSKEKVPAELFKDPAHACAGKAATPGTCPTNLECVVINSSM